MTIIEAINRIDDLKPNSYSQSQKVAWLSTLDGLVKMLIIDTHEGGEDIVFNGYTDETDLETELIVPASFDEMYLRWMEAQIDYANGEYGKYNNSITMYQAEFDSYKNHYNRNHMPLGKKIKFF